LLNISLVYIEYLDKQAKKDNTHLQTGMHPTIQNAAKGFIMGIGGVASYIAIKNE
jgi:hypothetical protein